MSKQANNYFLVSLYFRNIMLPLPVKGRKSSLDREKVDIAAPPISVWVRVRVMVVGSRGGRLLRMRGSAGIYFFMIH